MSAGTLDIFGSKGESIRTLLRVIILFLIAGAAISSRLFSVIRESAKTLRGASWPLPKRVD